MQNEYVWTAAGTDITKRWKLLYNYVPASEQPEIKQKWKDFKELMARSLEAPYDLPR